MRSGIYKQTHTRGRARDWTARSHLGPAHADDAVHIAVGVVEEGHGDGVLAGGDPVALGRRVDLEHVSPGAEDRLLPANTRKRYTNVTPNVTLTRQKHTHATSMLQQCYDNFTPTQQIHTHTTSILRQRYTNTTNTQTHNINITATLRQRYANVTPTRQIHNHTSILRQHNKYTPTQHQYYSNITPTLRQHNKNTPTQHQHNTNATAPTHRFNTNTSPTQSQHIAL